MGNYAYVADGGSGLQIIDIGNPTAPTLKGNYDTSGDAYDVQIVGNYAYVTDGGSGLQIIDISNPTTPTLKGNYDTSDYARGVQVVGNYAYVADFEGGLKIIDVSDLNQSPTNLALSNSTIAENQAIGTAVGTFSSTDPDTGNTFTYSLVTGTGDTYNALTDNQLQSNAIFDYEAQNSYSIRVQTTDQSGLFFEKELIIGITNVNEGTLSFSSPQFSVNEDGTTINEITINRTEGSTGEVSIVLNLTDGTATAGSDYDGTPITITFADGETSKTVDIPIVDDTLYEGDETLNLTLSNPTNGATIGTQTTASLTIIDNNINNAPSVINNITNQKSNADKLFTFTLPTNIFIDPDGDTLTGLTQKEKIV